jgi:hypothetical protein
MMPAKASQKMQLLVGAVLLLTSCVLVHIRALECDLHWGQTPEHVKAFTLCEQLSRNSSAAKEGRHATSSSLHLTARGVQAEGNMLRLRRFAAKMLRGDQITVGVAGGSFSTGQSDEEHKGGCAHHFECLYYAC